MDSDKEKDKAARALRLRLARAHAKFDEPTEAAKFYNWTVSTYLSHENGTRGLTPTVAKKYAKTYKVSFPWLMSGEGTMTGPGIDADLAEMEQEESDELIKQFRRMIAAAKTKPRLRAS